MYPSDCNREHTLYMFAECVFVFLSRPTNRWNGVRARICRRPPYIVPNHAMCFHCPKSNFLTVRRCLRCGGGGGGMLCCGAQRFVNIDACRHANARHRGLPSAALTQGRNDGEQPGQSIDQQRTVSTGGCRRTTAAWDARCTHAKPLCWPSRSRRIFATSS